MARFQAEHDQHCSHYHRRHANCTVCGLDGYGHSPIGWRPKRIADQHSQVSANLRLESHRQSENAARTRLPRWTGSGPKWTGANAAFRRERNERHWPSPVPMEYAFGMRHVAGTLRLIAVFAIAAMLLQATLVSPACLSLTNGQTSPITAAAGTTGTGDDGCCAFCFCCHFSGVLESTFTNTFLHLAGLLRPSASTSVPEPYRPPVDLPPRV